MVKEVVPVLSQYFKDIKGKMFQFMGQREGPEKILKGTGRAMPFFTR